MQTLNNLLIVPATVCLAVTGFSGLSQAQEFVDTTPSSKNVILEEYTGYRCQFCPDGHKTAEQIRSNNPNSVTLINIHTGRLAQPRNNAPDFRTNYASSLSSEFNVRGLPSATINRKPFNFDYSSSRRTEWSRAANQVLNESSPVNVAIRTSLEPGSRKLTIEVEVYYTDSGSSNTNKLNVALLQNNIAGPQIDGGDFYPSNFLENGEYKHKHVLRELITGQWGETINQPYEDSLFSKTYVYTIPQEIRSVPVKLNDLEVAAYVSEGRKNVYTGTSEKVSVNDTLTTDLSVTKASQIPNDICLSEVSPTYKVSNNGNQEVTSFDATINFNGQSINKTFNRNLASGQSINIKWDKLSLPGGDFNVQFDGFSDINRGDLLDDNLENDFAPSTEGISFLDGALPSSTTASFDRGVPEHFALDQSRNSQILSINSSRNPVGWRKSSGAIAQIVKQNIDADGVGKPGYITFGKIDPAKQPKPRISFFYEYAVEKGQSIGTAPEFAVQYSTDCGQNWETVAEKAAKETSSFTPTRDMPFYLPSSTDNDKYQQMTFYLSDLKGEGEVVMRIAIKPNDGGNIVWIDQISTEGDIVSVNDKPALTEKLAIYPNPVQDVATVEVELAESRRLSGSVVNSVGKTVKNIPPQTLNSGKQNLQLDVSDLKPGIYFANFNVGDKVKNLKLAITD